MHTAWIAFGSNQSDPVAQLLRARQTLAAVLQEEAASSLYRTPPWGYTDQPDFINAVIRYRTHLPPLALLAQLQRVEQAQGRERPFKNAPRTLDLDVLLYDDVRLNLPQLTVPHPGIYARAFVLYPLAELNPELPLDGVSLHDWLMRCDTSGITRISHDNWQAA